jgi:hypothetical protein
MSIDERNQLAKIAVSLERACTQFIAAQLEMDTSIFARTRLVRKLLLVAHKELREVIGE